jgi:MFS family permease
MSVDTDSGLFARPGYRSYLAARAIAWAGSAITLVALPILIYQRTASPSLTALLLAFEAAPYLLLGLFAGAYADRHHRRTVMVVATIVDVISLASIPAADFLGVLTVPHLLLVALAAATTWVFFDAANWAVLPALVGRDNLAAAMSTATGISTVLGLAGPAVGGALAALIGPATTIAIDAAGLAVAALLLARLPAHAAGAGTGTAERKPFRADIGEGLRYIWRQPIIRAFVFLGIGNSLTGGAVFGLLVVVGVQHLGLSDSDARLGWLYTAGALGTLATSIAFPFVSKRVPVGWITIAALIANCAFLALWATAGNLYLALAAILLWQCTYSLAISNGIVARQNLTPDHLQGRVNTTGRMIAWGGQPLGAILAAMLVTTMSVRDTLLIAGAGTAISAIAACFTPLRHRHTTADVPLGPVLVPSVDKT